MHLFFHDQLFADLGLGDYFVFDHERAGPGNSGLNFQTGYSAVAMTAAAVSYLFSSEIGLGCHDLGCAPEQTSSAGPLSADQGTTFSSR